MVDIPTLLTPRLKLRAYRLDDFDTYAAMWQEPAVVRFIGGTSRPREASWASFLRQMGGWHHLGFGFFAIEDRESGAFIGEAGFHDLKRALVPSIEGTMETGWVLAGAMQGKGLAEEAMRAALGWAREHGKGERLTCMIEVEHAASLHVAGKLGFTTFARATYNGKDVTLLERPRLLAP
ncbi:GNAT family N-acetyltransferase [Ancylobacter sp. G4_0304]|uniref:GNAT family N-acetyltransferase n=1 Tax=Ancylobacter sp. G4_0304 TaxID=3114289 RepID=UPI0039C610CE